MTMNLITTTLATRKSSCKNTGRRKKKMIAGGVAMTTKMIAGGVTTKKKTSKTPHGINAMMSIPVLLTPVTEMLTWLKLKSLAFKTSGLLQIQFPTSGSWYSCTHGFSLFGSEQAHHILYQINLKFNIKTPLYSNYLF
jgi:hypothetical protein